jgi:hypothetical protein
MRRIVGALLVITFLNGCSLPLVGSITSSTVTSLVTGDLGQGIVSTAIDFGVHEATGRTPGEHLYASLSNKYTDKKLKKHFPNKEIKFPSWQTYVNLTDYTILDKYAPNFKIRQDKKPVQTFSKSS